MRPTILAALLLAQAALGQVFPSRARMASPAASGDNIVTTPQGTATVTEATTAAVQLYVSSTGNNSNACTGTGSLACLTAQGAINKIPKLLRHSATVTIAAGNFAGFVISGFIVDPSLQVSTAGLLIDGALTNVTPATGTATGTATGGTAGDGVITFGTLVDSGATWTTNDPAIVGQMLVITGGTGSGQTFPITANNGTTLTVANSSWTAPVGASSTYAIQKPSVHITSCAAAIPTTLAATGMATAGIQILDNENGPVPITVRSVDISAACSRNVVAQGNGNILLTQMTMSGATAVGVRSDNAAGSMTLTSSYVTIAAFNAVQTTNNGQFSASNDLIVSAAGTGISMANGSNGGASLSISSVQLNAKVGIITTRMAASPFLSSIRCNCASVALSACLKGDSGGLIDATSVDVTNCTYGLVASLNGIITSTQGGLVLSGNALVYGVDAFSGGSVTMATATSTLTATTAEMSVDTGAATAAFATLAASFACLPSTTGTMSRVCRR